jgi:hypothetical protein
MLHGGSKLEGKGKGKGKVKGKGCPCALTKYQAMKTYWGRRYSATHS